jgi:phosphatidylglycerophosphate synthase
MLDRRAIEFLRPTIAWAAGRLASQGVTATQTTVFGFAVGVGAAICLTQGWFITGLVALLISRLCDALDGAIARLSQPTDAGGFLDITLDFLFYASIPLAFAIYDPTHNALAAAILLAAFIGTGTSFLAFATLAAKRGMHNAAMPNKSFYFLGGLTEATETLTVFALMCLWPSGFPVFAGVFSALCALTIVTRIWGGWKLLQDTPTPPQA